MVLFLVQRLGWNLRLVQKSKMKNFITFLLITAAVTASQAQSRSFTTLKDKFSGSENVFSIRLGGFALRTVLWITGEPDWREDFGYVRNIRIINIPQQAFKTRHLSAKGFKEVLAKDQFHEMAAVYEDGDNVTVYMKDGGKRANIYFVLVESADEVTAVEIKGFLDPKKLIEDRHKQKFTNI